MLHNANHLSTEHDTWNISGVMFGHGKDHGYATAMSIGKRILFNGGTEYENDEGYE